MEDNRLPIDAPRSLKSMTAIATRRAMLNLPHIAPLRDYAAELRAQDHGTVPEFDPMDGGTTARLLFLMEKPGPMTDDLSQTGKTGSGFISRDNDDPTAEAIFNFMQQAGIAREETVLWNIIPWWNGSRKITPTEMKAGLQQLDALMDLLPEVTTVIAVGRRAARAKAVVEKRRLAFYCSAHPSQINRAVRPKVWEAIPGIWKKAAVRR
ncbi:uracil-DNA glycosylase [Paracoccus nototheniae]|uniref:Uracil-DNA glycosylase n=1 Tax=Paracoccus nototheniae TaxID=2489002 RepID=A0ABW4DUB6_9RHOB|nr:uracil-DNA glycosylase [Paracoccus nototheniae]